MKIISLCSCSFSGWTRRFADMDSCRISGFVFGPVLCHRSTVPLPLGSGLWHLSPHLLCHLPYHCTSYRVWQDLCYVDLMLWLVWKIKTTTIYALFFLQESAVTFVPLDYYPQSSCGWIMKSGEQSLLREDWNDSHCAFCNLKHWIVSINYWSKC